jgi:hypothetical protein
MILTLKGAPKYHDRLSPHSSTSRQARERVRASRGESLRLRWRRRIFSKVQLCPAEFAIIPDEVLIIVAILIKNWTRGFPKESCFGPHLGGFEIF